MQGTEENNLLSLCPSDSNVQVQREVSLREVAHVLTTAQSSRPGKRGNRKYRSSFVSHMSLILLIRFVPGFLTGRDIAENFLSVGWNDKPCLPSEIGGSLLLSPPVLRLLSYSGFAQGLMTLSPFPATPTGWCHTQFVLLSSSPLLDILAWCTFAVPSK